MTVPTAIKTGHLVVGSGLAGLTFALAAADTDDVLVVTKKSTTDASSSLAQGGIAGVVSDDDSFELHADDTLRAGAGLCHPDAVDVLVREGPARIDELIMRGAQFNMDRDADGNLVLALGREGGHSRNRIVHTADYTGLECERTLAAAAAAHPRIRLIEHLYVTDLALDEDRSRCQGVWAIDGATGESLLVESRTTLVATGGCGRVYTHTTNPPVATGDGVAMARRAGAAIANMEFVQFHPTTLYHPGAGSFLITEALRGEGAVLVNNKGERFAGRYHNMADLAPRDIVARAIHAEMAATGADCCWLDATHVGRDKLAAHFPTILEHCSRAGIDITREPIPVVPAQHYQCGGVRTNLSGETGIPGLYAAGEVACTGVHGANRLASNSLLEALVFGHRAALAATSFAPAGSAGSARPPGIRGGTRIDVRERTSFVRKVRRAMTADVGIVRNNAGLESAATAVCDVMARLIESTLADPPDHEARNIATTADLIVRSARMRHESRGLHYTTDYPEAVPARCVDTVIA